MVKPKIIEKNIAILHNWLPNSPRLPDTVSDLGNSVQTPHQRVASGELGERMVDEWNELGAYFEHNRLYTLSTLN